MIFFVLKLNKYQQIVNKYNAIVVKSQKSISQKSCEEGIFDCNMLLNIFFTFL